MKRKSILLVALTISMVAILAVGASLAYFTDADQASNVFTVGNIDIELDEEFEHLSRLMPATGSAQNGTLKNGVKKIVNVKNTGAQDAFVRVHIAIPNILDSGRPEFDAGKNVLHFNFASDSVVAGLWDWSKTAGAPYYGDWNYYETTIDGILYNVYVVTYETALTKDQGTAKPAMHQVYLDKKVTQSDVAQIKAALGDNWKIKVVAEGVQADGFDGAYEAFAASFPAIGSYSPWATTP